MVSKIRKKDLFTILKQFVCPPAARSVPVITNGKLVLFPPGTERDVTSRRDALTIGSVCEALMTLGPCDRASPRFIHTWTTKDEWFQMYRF